MNSIMRIIQRKWVKAMRKSYPAIFHKAEEGGFWITFPDLPECITEGDDMEEAYNMSIDALSFALTDRIKSKEELPKASDIENIEKPEDGIVINVQFDKKVSIC